MAYDDILAERLRMMLLTRPGVIEKNMFGGLGFLLQDNMCIGIWHNELVVRLDPTDAIKACKKPHVRPMDLTGKPMKGWLQVKPPGFKTNAALLAWVEQALEHAASLPPKKKKNAKVSLAVKH